MTATFRKHDQLGRVMLCLAAAGLWPQSLLADVTYSESRDKDSTTIVRMSVTPAAEPVPALKYRLESRDIDLAPGNAAAYYNRAFAEIARIESRARTKVGDEQLETWQTTGPDAVPLAALPLDKARDASRSFDSLIDNHLRTATMRRDCDWQLGFDQIRGPDLVAFLLPECQLGRSISRALVLRTRVALAEHRFDDAMDAMRMNYRLARDTAQVPLLVCGLVGVAEANMTNGTALESIASTGSPNLYWALAELPHPLVDLRPAGRFELEFGPRLFPLLDKAESIERSPAEWNRLYSRALKDLSSLGGVNLSSSNDLGAGLAATGAALLGYSHAKAQLIADGLDREQVDQMAVGQVMAIYSGRVYQRFADEFAKLWSMPYWEAVQRGATYEQALRAANPIGGGANREVLPIVSLLMPGMQSARAAQVRLERDIASLEVIEALRMYAANHAGRLPERLDDITEVPVPLNPATGRPFAYLLDGSTAVLDLPASDHLNDGNRRFEIKIAQPAVHR